MGDPIKIADSLEELLGIEKNKKKKAIHLTREENQKTKQTDKREKETWNQDMGKSIKWIDEEGREYETVDTYSDPQTHGLSYSAANSVKEEGFIKCPLPLNTIYITRDVYEKLFILAQAVNEVAKRKWGEYSEKVEIYCYLFTDQEKIKEDRPATITDIYIPYHKATYATVSIDEHGILDVKRYMEENKKVLLGWAHSHGSFDVFSSKTDNINHQLLLMETYNTITHGNFKLKYIYAITVNDKKKSYGVVLTQYPCGDIRKVEKARIEIIENEKWINMEEIFEQYIDEIYRKVKIEQPPERLSQEELIMELKSELLEEFYYNLKRAKDILFSREEEMSIDSLKDQKIFNEFLWILEEYDKYILENAEETFTKVIRKIFRQNTRSLEDI